MLLPTALSVFVGSCTEGVFLVGEAHWYGPKYLEF